MGERACSSGDILRTVKRHPGRQGRQLSIWHTLTSSTFRCAVRSVLRCVPPNSGTRSTTLRNSSRVCETSSARAPLSPTGSGKPTPPVADAKLLCGCRMPKCLRTVNRRRAQLLIVSLASPLLSYAFKPSFFLRDPFPLHNDERAPTPTHHALHTVLVKYCVLYSYSSSAVRSTYEYLRTGVPTPTPMQ